MCSMVAASVTHWRFPYLTQMLHESIRTVPLRGRQRLQSLTAMRVRSRLSTVPLIDSDPLASISTSTHSSLKLHEDKRTSSTAFVVDWQLRPSSNLISKMAHAVFKPGLVPHCW